ncbi:hypothetical protein [Romboutsia ilealis]|uniref:hypothetical protein n=1 Tax=Romboutsia ilealis TaxID=1115758 RepID=UPI0026F3B1BD|nr:hypothetical protein [Romboutsia ilealis]
MAKIFLDRERNLKFDLNALEIIEEMSGVSLDKAVETMNMKTLKVLLYSGLVHEDADLTLEKVGSMVTFENLQDVSVALNKCFKNLQK